MILRLILALLLFTSQAYASDTEINSRPGSGSAITDSDSIATQEASSGLGASRTVGELKTHINQALSVDTVEKTDMVNNATTVTNSENTYQYTLDTDQAWLLSQSDNLADAVVDAANAGFSLILVDEDTVLTENTVVGSTLHTKILPGADVTTTGFTLTTNGPLENNGSIIGTGTLVTPGGYSGSGTISGSLTWTALGETDFYHGRISDTVTATFSGPFKGPVAKQIFDSGTTINFSEGSTEYIDVAWKSDGTAAENSTSIQWALGESNDCGSPARYFKDITYDTTLTFAGGEHLRGLGWNKNANVPVLTYSGTGDGFANATPATRIWDVRIEDICLVATSTSNAGDGLDLTDVNRFYVKNVWIEGFGGKASTVVSSQATGIAQCTMEQIYGYHNANGLYVGASSGTVSDSYFKNIMMRDIQKPDGTASTGILFEIEDGTTRTTFDNLTYKQESTMAISKAIIFKSGAGNNKLISSGGEINQTANELEIESGATNNTLVGFFAQAATRIVISDDTTNAYINQYPQMGRYAWNYAQVSFTVAAPAANQTILANMLDHNGVSGVDSFKTPFDGSIVGMSVKRFGGSQATGGGCTFYGARYTASAWGQMKDSAGNNSDINVGLSSTIDEATDFNTVLTEAFFTAGDLIGATFSSTAAWDGTGTYVVTLFINYRP